MVEKYGDDAVRRQSRSVGIDFGVVVDADDNTDYRVVSVDVVPAFAASDDYEIPDDDIGRWIKTNPEVHASKATEAHQAFSNEWKGLVRMAKYWNNNDRHGEKPIKPSFLIEVMALQCLYGGWQGRFDYEIQDSSRRWLTASTTNGPIQRASDRRSATAWMRPLSGARATS